MEKVRKHYDGLFDYLARNETIRAFLASTDWCADPPCEPFLTEGERSTYELAKDALIFKSFTDDRCGPSMTGYVGPASGNDYTNATKQNIIDVVTQPGSNIREIFGLLYCSTKDSKGFDGNNKYYFQNLLRFNVES